MRRNLKAVIFFLMAALLFSPLAYAGQLQCPPNAKLERLVNLNLVKFHQRMLMEIAERHDTNRAAGTSGYDASADYVSFLLRLSGLDVDIQEFDFPYFNELSDPYLKSVDPAGEPYTPNDPAGFYTMTYSGASADIVEGDLVVVDVVMPPAEEPNTSNSGCEAADFEGLPMAGAIALIQRGTCSFYDKALNAQNAGAVAVIVYNEGQEGRTDAIRGTLGEPDFTIPVVFASYDIGKALYDASLIQTVRVAIQTDTISEIRKTHNILAATKGGDPTQTVIVGAHLDSVQDGPGINDNGSGSAIILEAATKLAWYGLKPKNKIIFAFWGAEELGLLGSEHYVSTLTDEQIADIALYLNFDMVASPNYVRYVFDGDGSDTEIAGPPGSGFIEELFVNYFAGKSLPTDPTALDGRSDYASFTDVGIPIGGLFTGAGEIKTEEQAALYGGTAGEPLDANYHTINDNIDNLNYEIERQMLKAMAYCVDYFSTQTLPVSGARVLRAAPSRAPQYDYRGPDAVR